MSKIITQTAKFMCRRCLDAIVARGKACAFRSMGDEFCQEAEELDRAMCAFLTMAYKKELEAENAN